MMDFSVEMEEYRLFEDLVQGDSLWGLSAPSLEEEAVVVGKSFLGDGPTPLKLVIDQEGQDVLDDLLQLNSSEDALESEWMEKVDLCQFLNTTDGNVDMSSIPKPQETHTSNTSHSVLHELLTQPIVRKAEVPPSPEAQVAPELSQYDFLESEITPSEADILQLALAGVTSSSDTDVLPEISFDSGIGESDTSINTDSSVLATVGEQNLLDLNNAEQLIGSPLSSQDIDSLLGSEPCSPSASDSNDPDYIPYEERDYTPKSKPGRKTTAVPYEKPTKGMDKKDRKKLQNKNAAIRYRQKKREEKGGLNEEVATLTKLNTELKDQVDSITREIKYMKDLITEVCKAKGLKVTFKNKNY
uniref:cAMP response element binding protein 2 n=1 Tax=Pteria penguin TaxID=113549 RepID=A0A125QZY8_PTEPN|nr:cAMP response element binding protein 2 [Pteria penguin]